MHIRKLETDTGGRIHLGKHQAVANKKVTDGAGPPDNSRDKDEDRGKLSAPRAYLRLWTYANLLDVLLRLIGTAAALGGGSAYPLMTLILGNLVNAFNGVAVGSVSLVEFQDSINQNSLWFVYLFLGKFGVSSFSHKAESPAI